MAPCLAAEAGSEFIECSTHTDPPAAVPVPVPAHGPSHAVAELAARLDRIASATKHDAAALQWRVATNHEETGEAIRQLTEAVEGLRQDLAKRA